MRARSESRLVRHRERVGLLRQSTRERFDRGIDAVELARALALQTDGFLVELFDEAADELATSTRLAREGVILAVGGSGRGEMSPYSDVDLLFLESGEGGLFAEFASQVVRDCWDVGLQLGHGLHNQRGAISLALAEAEFATSLIEARCLWGDRGLAEQFQASFQRRVITRRADRFFRDCVAAREVEWDRHDRSASELVPDVKRSPGGLRDIHLIRWLGSCCNGATNLDRLADDGILLPGERDTLVSGHAFLTGVRIDLHLQASRPQDILIRDEQLRLAEKRGVVGGDGLRPVERFMQQYFQHTTAVSRVVERFIDRHRPRSLPEKLYGWFPLPRRVGRYRIHHRTLDASDSDCHQVVGSFESMLELFEIAATHRVEPAAPLLDMVTAAAAGWDGEISAEASRSFMAILSRTGHVGTTLRHMFQAGVLDHLVPAMTHTRCLMQFNQYHSFTVDEHSLRAVEAAEGLNVDPGPVGAAYRAIQRKDLLHLALLLHDLGKGFEEDHSEVGRKIAQQTAERLGLDPRETNRLVFLVHQHLVMEQLATRRDLSDSGLVAEFSHAVGSPETLRMLYALTAADIIAVGPGKWTDWKADLLTVLFDRSLLMLGGEPPRFELEQRIESVREKVGESFSESGAASQEDRQWLDYQLDVLTPHYLSATPPATITADLRALRDLADDDVQVDGKYLPETGTVELRILVGSTHAGGCFHRIAGSLTALRLEVLGADISTSGDNVVIDRFWVVDHDIAGTVTDSRIAEIGKVIREAVLREITVRQLFDRHRRFGHAESGPPVSDFPTRVVIDVNSSPRCTIVDVFAHDRPGLLYLIARNLFQMGLSVELARIATHVDQVVDVFYVVDGDGRKVEDPVARDAIVERLEEAIARLGREGFLESATAVDS